MKLAEKKGCILLQQTSAQWEKLCVTLKRYKPERCLLFICDFSPAGTVQFLRIFFYSRNLNSDQFLETQKKRLKKRKFFSLSISVKMKVLNRLWCLCVCDVIDCTPIKKVERRYLLLHFMSLLLKTHLTFNNKQQKKNSSHRQIIFVLLLNVIT